MEKYLNQAFEYSKQLKHRVESELDKVGGTDMEVKVKQATSMDNWPCPQSKLYEIAQATNDYQLYREIMPLLWKRLTDSQSWRIVFKASVLAEALLKHGSERCIDELRDRLYTFKQLQDYRCEEDGKDRGSGVREKCKQIVDLLQNHELLKQQRAEAAKLKEKYVGVSNRGEMQSYGGSAFGSMGGGYGDVHSAYDGQTRRQSVFDEEQQTEKKSKKEKRGSKTKLKKSKKKEMAESESEAETQSPVSDLQISETEATEKKKKDKKKNSVKGESVSDTVEENSKDKDKKKKKKKKNQIEAIPVIGSVLAPPPSDSAASLPFDDFGAFDSAAPTKSNHNKTQDSNSLDMFDTLANRQSNNTTTTANNSEAQSASVADWDNFQGSSKATTVTKSTASAVASSSFDLFSQTVSTAPSTAAFFDAISSSNNKSSSSNTTANLLDEFTAFTPTPSTTTQSSNKSTVNSQQQSKASTSNFLTSPLEQGLVNLNLRNSKPNQQGAALHIHAPTSTTISKSLDPFHGLLDPTQQQQSPPPRLSYNDMMSGFPPQPQQQTQQQTQAGFGQFPAFGAQAAPFGMQPTQQTPFAQQQAFGGMQQTFGMPPIGFPQPSQQASLNQFNQQAFLSSFQQTPAKNPNDVFFR